ncbi:MAG: hypothetical protein Q8R59_09435 [Polaromonas sp.]|nr:hypothetical protein [Polaromonas sp.]
MFAVNFYQYVHQRAYMDGQVAALEGLALALTQKHLALAQLPRPGMAGASNPGQSLAQRLKRINDRLSVRELDVCALVAGYDPVRVGRGSGPRLAHSQDLSQPRLCAHGPQRVVALLQVPACTKAWLGPRPCRHQVKAIDPYLEARPPAGLSG